MVKKEAELTINESKRSFLKGAGVLGLSSVGMTAIASDTEAKQLVSDKDSVVPGSPGQTIYLNSATEGIMSGKVVDRLHHAFAQWVNNPTQSYETNKVLGKYQHQNRESIARFLSVSKDNVTITDNTTMGLSMTLLGLSFTAGDKVVTTNHEHTATRSPLAVLERRLGLDVIVRRFPDANTLRDMSAAQIVDSLLPNEDRLRGAKALCVSHVYPATGLQLPLKLLREKADALNIQYLVVDGAQGFGMLDLGPGDNAISHADFYACPGHKWLNAPPGTGLLFIKNAAIRPPEFYPVNSQRMQPFLDEQNPTPMAMAEALQVRGCSNAPGFAAMITALEEVQDMGGPKAVEHGIVSLSAEVKRFVLSKSPGALISPHADTSALSGLTAFFPFRWQSPDTLFKDKETADRVVSQMLKLGIRIRAIGFDDPGHESKRVYALRVSTASFNSSQDLEALQAGLAQVLSTI